MGEMRRGACQRAYKISCRHWSRWATDLRVGVRSSLRFETYLLSLRFVDAVAAHLLAEIRSSLTYCESSFFWRESSRWRYLAPSLL